MGKVSGGRGVRRLVLYRFDLAPLADADPGTALFLVSSGRFPFLTSEEGEFVSACSTPWRRGGI